MNTVTITSQTDFYAEVEALRAGMEAVMDKAEAAGNFELSDEAHAECIEFDRVLANIRSRRAAAQAHANETGWDAR